MIKNVIFDFDDTLTHTHRGEYTRHMKVAKKMGLPKLTKNQFLTMWGPPWSVLISQLWPACNVKKFQLAYKSMFGFKRHKLVGGAKKTLDYLKKKGYQIYVLSSRDDKSLMHNLQTNGIHDHFKQIHSADHAQFHKPDPRVFTDFAEQHGLNIKESAYIGDLLIDYEGASKAGMEFIAVLTGIHDKEKFVRAGLNPKNIIPSIKELPEWLMRNNK
ncbi:MAG: HAD family hydrolase [Nanoarchaeota archaeon]